MLKRLYRKWLNLRYDIAVRDLVWMHGNFQICATAQSEKVCAIAEKLNIEPPAMAKRDAATICRDIERKAKGFKS